MCAGRPIEFANEGYETETLRIVTQPLADLVQGQSETQALAYLKNLDDLGGKENFLPNIGPAMMSDSDDPRTMRLLEKALLTLPHINSSAIIAGDDGIHWKVIHESASLVHGLTEHSRNSQANFSFTATAMLKPYGPSTLALITTVPESSSPSVMKAPTSSRKYLPARVATFRGP